MIFSSFSATSIIISKAVARNSELTNACSKGFSEADIQDMSAQFIEEFGVEKVVKKKEDTIKSGSGFSMLSGTESKSKSPEPSKPTQSQTKAINTNPTMPDFGLKLGFPILSHFDKTL